MPTYLVAVLVLVGWAAIGITGAVVLLGRHGYRDRRWNFIGAVLGPLFVPIAAERGRRATQVLERGVLVGVADADIAEFRDEQRLRAWHDLLADRAAWLAPTGQAPVREMVCGQPDRGVRAG